MEKSTVKLNDVHAIRLKMDTGSDTCTLTTEDMERSQLAIDVKPSSCVLNKYGGGTVGNLGRARLKVSCRGKATYANFKIVEIPGNPSILGCRQALELGQISLNIN